MGFEFLFINALWALPLAGLPILLHLLFRRKSPIVPFSTLRFIKTSLQHTAARKKVQRWLLLATRALLLLLLIWAIAQPARRLASGWFGGGSTVAAIVVDTSYSMLYQDQQVPLIDRAGNTVEELLRGQLADAQIALFRSLPQPNDNPEQLRSAAEILASWTPLAPQPSPVPLSTRITAAIDLLKKQEANQKWLIIITDLQSREFPQPLSNLDGLRVAMIDLHPDNSRAAGITGLSILPQQPIPGITSEAIIDLAGRSGDSRPVALSGQSTTGEILRQLPATLVRFDAAGRAQLRSPIELPPQRWLKLTATLQNDDPTPWDNTRSLLVEVPPRQNVTLLADDKDASQSLRFIQLALDPSEGKLPNWPLAVKRSATLTADSDVIVEQWSKWPDDVQTARLRDFSQRGGTIILFLQPGLESTWPALDDNRKQALLELLPGEPTPFPDNVAPHPATLASATDPLLAGIAGDIQRLGPLMVRRWVPMTPTDPAVTTLLRLTPPQGTSVGRIPLLARRRVGAGRVFTWSTLPESRFTNLPLHPVFLQLLVPTSLPPAGQSAAQNTEIGSPLSLPARLVNDAQQLDIESPSKQITRVDPTGPAGARAFTFNQTTEPGDYLWHKRDQADIVALANVQLPAHEAELTHRPADDILPPADNVVVAKSLQDLSGKISELSEPSPRWSWAIALVLFLMCIEAMMASISRLWKPINWRGMLTKTGA